MDVSRYLFPNDLERTPTSIRRVLLVGSCLSDMYGAKFRDATRDVHFDRVMFNNAQDLPEQAPSPIEQYDLQYIQIPLRSVIGDGIINAVNLRDKSFISDILNVAKRNLEAILTSSLTYNRRTGLLSLIANFIVPQVRVTPSLFSNHTEADLTFLIQELNVHLAHRLREFSNVVYVDVDAIASSLGKRYFLDDAVYFYSHNTVVLPYWTDGEMDAHWTAPEPGRIEPLPSLPTFYENRSDEFFTAVYRQIEATYRVVHQIDMVKLVIFDLDNTLWRGQIAEHYQPGRRWPHADNWPVGVWEAVHHLRWRGIITSIASKNDFDVVRDRWDDVVQPPLLKFSDFVHPQIGWQSKAESVERILNAVNVTAKSAVFVDDNPVEREIVQNAFPEIRVIGSNPFMTRRILLWAPETQVSAQTNESLKRETMIRGQIDRETQRSSVSREDFLNGLGCSLVMQEIVSTAQTAFTRVLELVNKTNQFNTTGQRWSNSTVRRFLETGRIFSFSVADRFVEYGLVGVIFTSGALIEQFVMSCRVIGMDVERAAIAAVVSAVRVAGSDGDVSARLLETQSNGPCRAIYSAAGFGPVSGKQLFTLAKDRVVQPAPHVAVSWLETPVTPKQSEVGSNDWCDAMATPQGETFNGAIFRDGGWLIPEGSTGDLTYLRHIMPVQSPRSLKGELGKFSIELATSPNILDVLKFSIDFNTLYSNVGYAGHYSNPHLRSVGDDTLIIDFDYIFSGGENCVVCALQVKNQACLSSAQFLSIARQQYAIV